MKRILIFLSFAILLITSVITFLYIGNERQLDAQELLVEDNGITLDVSDNVTIGLIGDSWVAGKKLDQYIQSKVESAGFDVEVISYGHPGAKSRQIYRDLFSEEESAYSSNSLLKEADIDIMVIIAGVNDAAGHIGKDFYAHHVNNIVKVANNNSVYPLVLELPEFDIETPVSGIASRLKQTTYKFLYDKGETRIIADYREELESNLSESDLTYEIIPFDPVAADFSQSKEIYNDPWHLNEEGNEILGSHIGQSIVDLISN